MAAVWKRMAPYAKDKNSYHNAAHSVKFVSRIGVDLDVWAHCVLWGGSFQVLGYAPAQVVVLLHNGVLWKFGDDVFGWTEENAMIGDGEHGGVVVGVAGGDYSEVEILERGNSFLFAVGLAEVIGDDVGYLISGINLIYR